MNAFARLAVVSRKTPISFQLGALATLLAAVVAATVTVMNYKGDVDKQLATAAVERKEIRKDVTEIKQQVETISAHLMGKP